jgi:ribosomal protein L29
MASEEVGGSQISNHEVVELRNENNRLKHEIAKLRAQLQTSNTQVQVLKQRPAYHDPLSMSLQPLPVELQTAIQVEVLTLPYPIGQGEIQIFMEHKPTPIASNFELPFSIRPQYFKAFLQSNNFYFEELWELQSEIDTYIETNRLPYTLQDCIRHLRLLIDTEDLFVEPSKIGDQMHGLGNYAKLQHLTISFNLQEEDIINHYNVDKDLTCILEDVGFVTALQSLRKLKAIVLEVDIGLLNGQSEELQEAAKSWMYEVVALTKKTMLESNSRCVVTDALEE